MNWILDFDDTLVMGPNTWAFETVLPDLIATHGLPYDAALFETVTLRAQQGANEDIPEEALLNFVFESLGWPASLKKELINRVFAGYQAHLFDDARPFLDQLMKTGHTVYLVTNNDHAVNWVQHLGLQPYFRAIISPKASQSRAKPHRDMWDVLNASYALSGDVAMVGDDPWSDGSFAQKAGIPCWILDRLGRYESLHESLPHRWVQSLSEIGETLR